MIVVKLCIIVQSLSHDHLFASPWTAALQASLSLTNSWSLLKLMSIKSVMPSNHLILCPPLLLQYFSSSGSFPISQFFTSGGQNIGASASAFPGDSVVNLQDIQGTWVRSLRKGDGNPLWFSCQESPPVDRVAWWTAVSRVTKN